MRRGTYILDVKDLHLLKNIEKIKVLGKDKINLYMLNILETHWKITLAVLEENYYLE